MKPKNRYRQNKDGLVYKIVNMYTYNFYDGYVYVLRLVDKSLSPQLRNREIEIWEQTFYRDYKNIYE